MKHSQSVAKLSKFLFYVLGKHPDEFGLVPDENGFVKIKDLIKVMSEESGWRHIRLSHIKEVSYTVQPSVIEIDGKNIRAIDRSSLFLPVIPIKVPKLLYRAIRQRAYPFVHERGLLAGPSKELFVLSEDEAFARRLGRRIDQHPVILTINTDQAINKGVHLKQFGKLFLTEWIPTGCFSGPPLPKERLLAMKQEPARTSQKPKTAGSYFLELTSDPSPTDRPKRGKGKRKNEWKRERKRRSRNKGFG